MAAGGEEVSTEGEWGLLWAVTGRGRETSKTPQLLVGMAEGLVTGGCGML